ncbi:MAG: superoxide dismutase [Gemmataceae bacterium]|nr:superoxide dismutase [Gemmataceae bacterium]
MLTRRDMLRATAAGATVLAVPGLVPAADKKGFTLPKLPYGYDALEPVIDTETMTIHHTKHHQAYVDNLNKALGAAPDWLGKPIEEVVANYKKLPEAVQTAVRNNGGGHLNHTWFWNWMAKPGTGGEPKGDLAKALDDSFGGLDGFKKAFTAAATGRFGSGWAWLVVGGKDGKPLAITSSPNQDNPITDGKTAVLGIDVWEHAYYLKYKNARPKYVEAWFGVINWDTVADLYAKAKKG